MGCRIMRFLGVTFLKALSLTTALVSTNACIFENSETIEIAAPDTATNLARSPARNNPPYGSAARGTNEPDENSNTNNSNDNDNDEKLNKPAQFNQRFAQWFGSKTNYDLVYKDVLSFYPEGRYNGCVAFLSAALRRMNVSIPIRTATESPSLITKPFSNYLQNSLGWNRIKSADDLLPGDIVFTKDNASYPGYPAHTYMFYGWSNKSAGIAFVIDNQEFTHERNIYSSTSGFNFTPYAYALRAPY